MKRILIIFFLLSSSLLFGSYVEYRNLFAASPNDEAKATLLIEKTKNATTASPLDLGYLAGAKMAMANHCYLPTNKLKYFNEGKNLLQKAIVSAPNNIELRFIRFSIQCNVPSFLGYNSNLAVDKTSLINHLKSAAANNDADLKTRIKNFLLLCNECTEAEKTSIRNL